MRALIRVGMFLISGKCCCFLSLPAEKLVVQASAEHPYLALGVQGRICVAALVAVAVKHLTFVSVEHNQRMMVFSYEHDYGLNFRLPAEMG